MTYFVQNNDIHTISMSTKYKKADWRAAKKEAKIEKKSDRDQSV